MIHWAKLLQLLGYFVLGLSVGLLATVVFAFASQDGGIAPLCQSLAIALAIGSALLLLYRRHAQELSRREGILLVVGTWVAASLLGALPFYLSPHFSSFSDAFFESASGFTTTGATVLEDVEVLPNSLLLWRALTHWFGGMGIILLGIAILPLIGAGGRELYRAEFSGARAEKLKPRIAQAALALWKIYLAFTVLEFGVLWWAGMTPFESICHTFSTMATGGFSTRKGSIEAFNSPTIEWIIFFFMILAGINFTQHYRLFVERKPSSFFSDLETRSYFLLIAAAAVLLTLDVAHYSHISPLQSARPAVFQAVSIMTTTGFSSTDFESWSPFSQLLLLVLMFVGGCTGSTAGGMKTARVILLKRVVGREFRRMVEPHGIFAVRFGGRAIPESTIQSLLNLVYLALLINFTASICLTALGMDVLTAISAVAASMFNIGPGLGQVGPSEHYGHLPALAKWILSGCMLAGRLEYYTLLVLFTRPFWRK